ncbi:10075_t:CDS:2 [Diversispora eburnea]|uniref:10075_t:CDS:1 n=1 Tax=Diversispora eburnea TaxID=1213867 RepID=A0A9N8W892_9GLOM|nr:10075_t:CDS:2 [Diversispora eburnea]
MVVKKKSVNVPYPLTYDCFEEILKHLIGDPGTLFYCLLVNRHWCRVAVPLLWSRPFEYHGFGEPAADIIQIYVSCLPEVERQNLIDEGLELPPLRSPLFDYPNYLQSFESAHFTGAVMLWLSTKVKSWLSFIEGREPDLYSNTYLVQKVIGNLLFSRSKGLKDLDIVHFDEDDDSLIADITSFNDSNKTLSRLEKFQFDYSGWAEQDDKSSEIISNLFNFMSKWTRNIQHIYISITIISNPELEFPQIAQSFAQLIESQRSLRELIIMGFWTPSLFNALTTQANSLTFLRIHELYQDQFLFLLNILPTLKNLETLQFWGFCGDYDESIKVNTKNGTITNQINIKHLHYKAEKSQIDIFNYIGPLIQMASSNLKTLSLESVTPELCLLIGQSCPNVTHLSLSLTTYEIPDTIFHLLSSITNLLHFSLYIYSSDVPFATTESLTKFSLSIPPNLVYFGFHLAITPCVLEYFLKHCQAKLQVLAIYRSEIIDENLITVIKDYKKERDSLRKLLIDPGVNTYEGSTISKALIEANKFIPIIDTVIENSYSFSGPEYESFVDLWNQDIILTPEL